MSKNETQGQKSVPSDDSIEDAEIPEIVRGEFPDLDDSELLMWAVETGLDEIAGMCKMLEEESTVYKREDGAHVVDSEPGYDGEGGRER